MMASLTLPVIAERLGAPYSGPALALRALAIDSRAVAPGDLFVALPGERVDGHEFIEAAIENGAVAALVERPVHVSVPCLQVASGVEAMATIAAENRAAFQGQLIAITGSCGKTSVKNMCRAIFSLAGNTVATVGNYNNELGVPLTLSRLNDDTRFAVVEMGAAGRGHVAHLCALARPDISTVLNAMEAHLEGFGSVADVAAIKAEIFDGLSSQGVAVLNLDQPWVSLWQGRIADRQAATISFSVDDLRADVTATDIEDHGLDGSVFTLSLAGSRQRVSLPLPGRHNVSNALAAAALGLAAGLPVELIARGLERSETERGRLASEVLADGTVLIDDAYNANPGSVRAAIELLAGMTGRRSLVLGAMLELGAESARQHFEMGALARRRGIEQLIAVGAEVRPALEGFGDGARYFDDRKALQPALPELLKNSDAILLKGSRGAAMDSLLGAIRDLAGETH